MGKEGGIKGAELVAKIRSEKDRFFGCFFLKVKFLINLALALSAACVRWSI